MIKRSILVAVAALFSAGSAAIAEEDPIPRDPDFSTVELFFIDHQPATDLGLNPANDSKKRIKAGSLFLTASALRSAKIYLDDEFVSDAIFGMVSTEPKLHVESGKHTFRIESEGYKVFKSDIKVLPGGCVQYLVVHMQPEEDKPLAAAKANASARSAASR